MEEVNHGRSEPSELHGLRDQITKSKETPLELKRKSGKKNVPAGRGREKKQACSIERGALSLSS